MMAPAYAFEWSEVRCGAMELVDCLPLRAALEIPTRDHVDDAKRVLVVDDDLVLLEIVAKTLVFAGFVVETASSLVTLGAKVEAFRPRVILLDVCMDGPADSAVVALSALDRLWNPHAKIVLYSGLARVELDDRAKRIGAAGVLEKPATAQQLIEVVTRFGT